MHVEGINTEVNRLPHIKVCNVKNCSPIKHQNGCDSFVSTKNKNVSFGASGDFNTGSGIGALAGIVAGIVVPTLIVPFSPLGVFVAQTIAAPVLGVGGAIVGGKLINNQ